MDDVDWHFANSCSVPRRGMLPAERPSAKPISMRDAPWHTWKLRRKLYGALVLTREKERENENGE